MAKAAATFLDANDFFPELDIQLISGETLKLPEGFGEGYGVLLLYRGYWWPFCSRQLAGFQSSLSAYEEEQITVIAGAVDAVEKTKEFAEKVGVTFPVAWGMDAVEISRLTGAFYDKERAYIHPANFLVRPDKTIEVASYSTGPVGRFVAANVLDLVKFYKSRKKK